eukprot:8506017-Alexandrium_andersonii.AAC.1
MAALSQSAWRTPLTSPYWRAPAPSAARTRRTCRRCRCESRQTGPRTWDRRIGSRSTTTWARRRSTWTRS